MCPINNLCLFRKHSVLIQSWLTELFQECNKVCFQYPSANTPTRAIKKFKRSTFCRFYVVIRFFIPATTANDLRFSIPDFIHYIFFVYLNSWERAGISLFNVECQTSEPPGTIFITSLVWRGPWLGIEPGTSRTRSQHSTTKLSRRRYY